MLRDKSTFNIIDSFDSSYWSGLDVGIYIEDIYVAEAVNLQFQLVENRVPYFGYASYTWHHAAPGTRMVQGSFTINFLASAYIPALLDALGKSDLIPSQKQNITKVQQAYKGNTTLEEFIAQTKSKGKSNPAAFKALADAYDYALWGEDPVEGADQFPQDGPLLSADKLPKGFDIYLRYGEPLKSIGQQVLGADPKTWNNVNLKPVTRADNTPGIGTARKISGAYLTGFGQGIDDSGRNIMETYQFIARDIA